MSADRTFVMVTRKTRLQELVERFNSWSQAKFYLEHNQADVQDYLNESNLYQARLKESEEVLRKMGRFQQIERAMLPNYQFGKTDVVVVVGQDGLVANTLKYLDGQPVIAINPDPARWDGKLLPFEIGQLSAIVGLVLKDAAPSRTISFAEATTKDGQCMRAVNDLFIGPKSHTSARYQLRWGGKQEVQSSSGIIVTTGFGSTGWFQSVLAGAIGVTGMDSHGMQKGFEWDDAQLQFAVREPFPSQTTGTSLIFGTVTPTSPLELESLMPENGVLFSDGIENDYIEFNAGCIALICVSEIQGQLVVER
jgi:NAD kinase